MLSTTSLSWSSDWDPQEAMFLMLLPIVTGSDNTIQNTIKLGDVIVKSKVWLTQQRLLHSCLAITVNASPPLTQGIDNMRTYQHCPSLTLFFVPCSALCSKSISTTLAWSWKEARWSGVSPPYIEICHRSNNLWWHTGNIINDEGEIQHFSLYIQLCIVSGFIKRHSQEDTQR